jgi:phage gp29-like protein
MTDKPDFRELGATGLRRSGGYILEEFLPQLQGTKARMVYREMSDNDPVIGGILLAFNEVMGRLDWHIEKPEKATSSDLLAYDFIASAFDDTANTWDVTLSQILSMLIYGYSITEIIYKIRGGYSNSRKYNSKYSDGRIGWQNFAIRSQDSFLRWEFEKNGDVKAFIQQDITTGMHYLPMSKCLLFRTNEFKGNPEGISMLRRAYSSWYYKKRIQEIEAIGIERDLAGLPVVYAPQEWFSSGADEGVKASLIAVQNMVTQIKRNETEGVVLPYITNEDNQKILSLELLSSGGSRSFNTEAIIDRYNKMIATSMLADFVLLGQGAVGSFALGSQKLESWQMIIESMSKSIAEVFNKHAIEKLLRLNGIKCENPPKLVFGSVAHADLSALGPYLGALSDAGILSPSDPDLEAWARQQADIPPVSEV